MNQPTRIVKSSMEDIPLFYANFEHDPHILLTYSVVKKHYPHITQQDWAIFEESLKSFIKECFS